MKRKSRVIAAFFSVFVMIFVLMSITSSEASVQAATIRISNKAINLEVGKTKTLSVIGSSKRAKWSSSKSNIASVSKNGKVTAKSKGNAIIYASLSGIKLSSKVTVKRAAKKISPTPTATPTPKPTATPTPKPTATPAPTLTPTPVPVVIQPERVIGYYAAWARYSGFTPDKIDATKLTHINYAFANISADLKLELGYPDIDPLNISQLKLLKNKNPDLKLLIAIGGWSWSGRFSDAALTEASRSAFADSCVSFLVQYGFDGIDIDWEYPVSGGLSTNIRRPEDKVNFTLLMQVLREKLDAREAVDGKQYILSFAGAAGSWYLKNVEADKLSQYVDYVNVMTYDIHGTWETLTDFNAPLYVDSTSEGAQYKTSVDTSILAWINAGMPREKVIMGIPFYGYIYKSVANINDGLYQTYSGANAISFANIAANYLINPDL